MKDGWKITAGVIGALWLVTGFLAARTIAGYDTAISKLETDARALERQFYDLKSDVRLLNEQIANVAKNTGHLVTLYKRSLEEDEPR